MVFSNHLLTQKVAENRQLKIRLSDLSRVDVLDSDFSIKYYLGRGCISDGSFHGSHSQIWRVKLDTVDARHVDFFDLQIDLGQITFSRTKLGELTGIAVKKEVVSVIFEIEHKRASVDFRIEGISSSKWKEFRNFQVQNKELDYDPSNGPFVDILEQL